MNARRRFLASAAACAAASLLPRRLSAASTDWLIFSLNVQDFAYPDLSAALVARALDLHEGLGVPVDVYLTCTQADLFATSFPALFERLRVSPVAAVCYHVRPPKPYHSNYDWLGLSSWSAADQYDLIERYETHGLDLVTGQPTTAPGGYAALVDRLGYRPPCVGIACDAPVQGVADTVFHDLGATLGVVHGRVANLGDRRGPLYVRPEHVDLKLFEQVGRAGDQLIEEAVAQARATAGARPPYVVGVKMHDNDFFAQDSAWLTVYLNGWGRRPPWDVTRRSPLLSDAEQAALWALYEGAVRHAASQAGRLHSVSCRTLAAELRW